MPLSYWGKPLYFRAGLLLAELVFADTAYRAHPIIREVLKCCSRLYTIIGITDLWVVNVSTYVANILLHNAFRYNLKLLDIKFTGVKVI